MTTRRLLALAISLLAVGTTPDHANAAGATFDPSNLNGNGKSLAWHELSRGEVCIIPRTVPGLGSGTADPTQTSLCAIDFYDDTSIGICAKANSTNPGVDVYKLNGNPAKATFESTGCKQPERLRPAKEIAKFKQSITCSDSASILAYYELSQALGGIGDVPPTVIRTMSDDVHKRITQAGLGTAIHGSWAMYQKAEANPGAHPELFTRDGKYVYGALSKIPGGDGLYTAMVGHRADYDHGEDAFLATPLFRTIASANPIAVPNTLAGAAKQLIALKDTSDMVLIDTLLNQQDRFGNEAKRSQWVWVEDGKLRFVKADDVSPDDAAQRGAVLVDTLLLEDNDCGVSKRNWLANPKTRLRATYPRGVLPAVRHMSAKTYHRFMSLAAAVEHDPDGMARYFQTDLLFTPASWASVSGNIATARRVLHDNCVAGKLRLDLDLEPRLALATDFTDACD
jgi:hypothetical protein